MKFTQVIVVAIISLGMMAFTTQGGFESKDDSKKDPKNQQIMQVLKQQYQADFSRSEIKRLNRAEVHQWMNQNAQIRTKKLHAADMKVISKITKQKKFRIIKISDIRLANKEFNEVIVATVGPINYSELKISDYVVTNRHCSDDEEEAEPCTRMYGYELDLTGTDSPEDVNDRCPCMQESRTDGNCGGNCAQDCS